MVLCRLLSKRLRSVAGTSRETLLGDNKRRGRSVTTRAGQRSSRGSGSIFQLSSSPSKQKTERLPEDHDDVGGGHWILPHHRDPPPGDHSSPHPGQQVGLTEAFYFGTFIHNTKHYSSFMLHM